MKSLLRGNLAQRSKQTYEFLFQGLGNKIIHPEFASFPAEGAVNCHKRLGGLLRYYYREAA